MAIFDLQKDGAILAFGVVLGVAMTLTACATPWPNDPERAFADRCVRAGGGLLDGGDGRWFCDAERWSGSRYYRRQR